LNIKINHKSKFKDMETKVLTERIMKDEINRIFQTVSFRKFGNAFRKHIDDSFRQECNLASVGGQLDGSWTWSELASYIIGDGSYAVTEKQYKNFIAEFKK
jgi:hypothetical protein